MISGPLNQQGLVLMLTVRSTTVRDVSYKAFRRPLLPRHAVQLRLPLQVTWPEGTAETLRAD
jgi:hypothetical protein